MTIRWMAGAAAALGLAFTFTAPAVAQAPAGATDWPAAKPVRLVVPYAPGGSSDTLGRMVANQLQIATKQTFVVENRAGAGGVVGSQLVSKAPPDGYTLVISGIGSHVIAPVENKAIDPMADFTHIALLGGPPLALVVHPSLGVNTLREFIAHSQASRDGISWGSPGQGTHGHLVGELFSELAKLKGTHIAYKGAGPAMNDLVGGQIHAAVVTLSSANAHMASGRVKALAITTERRLPEYPDVPTFVEAGYPSLVANTWFSLSGPPGMAAPVVQKINAEVRRALKTEAAQKQMAIESMVTQDLDAAGFTQFMRREIDRWQPLVKVDKPKN